MGKKHVIYILIGIIVLLLLYIFLSKGNTPIIQEQIDLTYLEEQLSDIESKLDEQEKQIDSILDQTGYIEDIYYKVYPEQERIVYEITDD